MTLVKQLFTLFIISINAHCFGQDVITYGQTKPADSIKIVAAAPVFKAQGYPNLSLYIAEKLYQDPRTKMFLLPIIGANALIKFTVDKYGFVKNVSVDCSESRLILPLTGIIDSMPAWKPAISNDENVSTKMVYFYSITNAEIGQFVVREERMPPEYDKTTKNIKIIIISACLAIFAGLLIL